MSSTKVIHSRSNKEIGDVIEENWEITSKKVIAEPIAGDRARDIAPRHGIYAYEVKPIVQSVPAKATREKKPIERSVGGTRREASSSPLIVRRLN